MPKIVDDRYSIYCNASTGPVFGTGKSIHISNNSNTTTESYFNLGGTYRYTSVGDGSIEARSFLTGYRHFKTSEIEVFQIK